MTNPYNNSDLETKLISNLSRNRLPNLRQFKYLKKFLSLTEKWLLTGALLVFISSVSFLAYQFWYNHLVISPKHGGQYTEATLSAPSHINPLFFGLNNTDDDLVNLVFSSLWKHDDQGSLQADLVEKFVVSSDQKSYTITIIDKARWHSGEKLTTDDIIFTINTIKDARFKSPWRRYFIGVEAEKISDTEFKLSLKEPYSLFLEHLTFGILPQKLWQDISPDNVNLAELNIKPVGSGPFKFKSLTKDKSGAIKSYTLIANSNYHHQKAYLNEFSFKIFSNPEEIIIALNNNTIDGVNYLPSEYHKEVIAASAYNFHQLQQPKSLNIFFNLKSGTIISNAKLRQALNLALDKEAIIKKVYGPDASVADSPIAKFSFGYQASRDNNFDPNKAKELLATDNWKEVTNSSSSTPILQKNNQSLKLSLSVSNNASDLAIAELIASSWSKIGAQTEIISENSNFFNQVIKPKNYSILLYSTFNSINSDPYPFWHSSQIDDKGYNLSNYSNTKVDKLLEEARLDSNTSKRLNNYLEFQKIINTDNPAIFLANQNFVYIQTKKIKGFQTKTINTSADRLTNVTNWYLNEKKSLKL